MLPSAHKNLEGWIRGTMLLNKEYGSTGYVLLYYLYLLNMIMILQTFEMYVIVLSHNAEKL